MATSVKMAILFVATILIFGSLTGIRDYLRKTDLLEGDTNTVQFPIHFLCVTVQLPRTIISATSKWSTGTAPTSHSPGTLWMATTTTTTSTTSFCTTSPGTGLTCTFPHCTFLTAQQLAMGLPSATPAPWTHLTMDLTSCGCRCTDHPP